MAEQEFEFVGGPADGQRIPVTVPFKVGAQAAVPNHAGTTIAVYEASQDGRYHFKGMGSNPRQDEAPNAQAQAVLRKIEDLLSELDGIYRGGAYPLFAFPAKRGQWVLSRKL